MPLLAARRGGRPEDTRFAYVYGVALHAAGRGAEAMSILSRRSRARRTTRPALGARDFERDAGHREAALGYARRLAAVAPEDESVRGLVRALGGE